MQYPALRLFAADFQILGTSPSPDTLRRIVSSMMPEERSIICAMMIVGRKGSRCGWRNGWCTYLMGQVSFRFELKSSSVQQRGKCRLNQYSIGRKRRRTGLVNQTRPPGAILLEPIATMAREKCWIYSVLEGEVTRSWTHGGGGKGGRHATMRDITRCGQVRLYYDI